MKLIKKERIGGRFNLDHGDFTDWRLPTQKELQQAYVNGIWKQKTGLALSGDNYWSATQMSYPMSNAWYVHLNYGSSGANAKTGTNRVLCIR